MADPTIGSGFNKDIAYRYKPGQTQAEFYSQNTGQTFGGADQLASYINSAYQGANANPDNVFGVLAGGFTPRSQALDQIKNDLNSFQQQTFNSGDPTSTSRKSSSITDSIASEQGNYDTYFKEYNDLKTRLQALSAPNYQDSYNQLRQSSGIVGVEGDFANNQKTIRELPYVNRQNFGNGGVATEAQLQADTIQKGIPLEIQQANLLDRLKIAQSFIDNSLKFKELDTNAARQSLSDALNTTLQTIDLSRTHLNDLLAQQQVQKAQQEKAQQFAYENRIGKPFYDIGGTVYRTSDGRPATSPQDYLEMGGKGDFSDVQSVDISQTFANQLALAKQNREILESDRNFDLQKEQLQVQREGQSKFTLGTDTWGNPIVLNTRTGTFTGGDSSSGGSKPYYGLAPKIYDKAAAIVSQFDGEAIAKKYNIVADGNNYAQSIDPNTKNAAEHQALIYGLAKALDPDSVVREGEYATIQKYSQSWLEAFGFNAQRVINNQGLLSADAIKKVQSVIREKFNSADAQYQNLYSEYARRIDAVTNSQGKGNEMLTDYSKAYKAQSDPVLNNLWGDGFTTNSPLDLNKARSSGGLSFNSGTGITQRGASPAKTSQSGSVIFASAFPVGSKGGQCGDFARTLISKYGYDYPRVGDSLAEKAKVARHSGSPPNAWGIGTVLITNESKENGHVAVINAITPKGYQVSESNYSLNGKVNHTRIIPFNSPKLIGGINPTRKTQTA